LDVLLTILKVTDDLGDLVDLGLDLCSVERALLGNQSLIELAYLVLNLKNGTA
jgi:hypothetical protein